jgi:hypothetical protein
MAQGLQTTSGGEMFDEDSFETASFEENSWWISVLAVVDIGRRVVAKMPLRFYNKWINR